MLGFGHEHPGSTGGSNGSQTDGGSNPQLDASSAWSATKDYIRRQVMSGNATPEQQAWYNRWVYSGRPPTKRGMLTPDEMQAKMDREQLAASRPEGVSESIWLHANDGNMSGFNVTSVTRNPEVRDALIEAGFGDWVKAVHEKHMDQNAGHAIGNGANEADAWDRAQLDWYTQNYGAYGNSTVAGDSNIGSLGFGHEQAKPVGTPDIPYVPPTYTPPQPPAQQPPSVPEVQCGPGQVKIRGVCVDWDGPSGAGGNGGGNGGGQANPNRRGPSTGGTGYLGAGVGPANTGIGQAGQNQATPWADAYFRAKERANAQGPVSRLFAKELEGN